ncbi:MAG: alkaline phosphatase family protein, partial [Thermoplasmata archaeon]
SDRIATAGRQRLVLGTSVALLIVLLLVGAAGPSGVSRLPTGSGSPRVQGDLLPIGLSSPTLTVTGETPASLCLNWTATSDLLFSEYEIQDSTAGSTGTWSTAGTVGSQSDTSYFATGLTPGKTYWWQVVELDTLGVGVSSNVVQQAQPAVAGLTATVSSPSSVQLSWTNHASYGGFVAFNSYVVRETPGGGASTTLGTITSESTMTATAAGLSTGTSYTFQVETIDVCRGASNCGSSGLTSATYSNPVNATPASTAATYSVTFTEAGLPSGTPWSVDLAGSHQSSNGSSIAFTEPNGTYTYSVGEPGGYAASPGSGSVSVSGGATSQSISFSPLSKGSYSITFSETGLPSSSSWWVTLNGSTQHSTGTSIAFIHGNGTYPFTIGGPSGYSAAPSNGSVLVRGSSVTVPVAFGFSSGGGSSGSNSTASVDHVVLVMLENQEVTNLWKSAPYERYLAATFGNATNFYATCHSSTSLYLAVTSGNTFGCKSISANPGVNVTHLGDLLDHKGLTWMAYQESMPSPCDTTSEQTYLDYHDPFMFFQDVSHNRTRCDTHVVNSAYFNASLANGTLPTFSFYTPNYINDGHGPEYSPWNAATGLPHIEAFLKAFLPPILNHTGRYASSAERALVNHTAFILLYDEGVSNQGYTVGKVHTSGCYNQTGLKETACGGRVQLTVISPYSLHRTYTADATTYSVESTVEWLFGLPSDGGWDGTPNFPPLKSLFSFTDNHFGLARPVASAPSGGSPAGVLSATWAAVASLPLLGDAPGGLLIMAGGVSAVIFPTALVYRRRAFPVAERAGPFDTDRAGEGGDRTARGRD